MIYYCDNIRHLICVPYSVENLHKMADDLGIKRCWFHNAKYPHYDIPKRRVTEIQMKCQIVTQKRILELIKVLDSIQPLCYIGGMEVIYYDI